MSLFGKGYSNDAVKPVDRQKFTMDTGAYEGTVSMAYLGKSAGGAINVTLELALENGKTFKETIYVTNKAGENTYTKDGKEYYLPGFLIVNELVLLATSTDLFGIEDELETRTIKIRDFTTSKDVATDVQCLVPLLGAKLIFGIEEYEDEKKTKQGNDYVGTGEIRVRNRLLKAYDAETRQTYLEKADQKEATVLDDFLAQFKGKVRELKKTESANATTLTKPPVSSGLFGKK